MSRNAPRQFYEFFAAGGMARLGLGEAWTCAFANDFDPVKSATYRANFADAADHFRQGDVWKLEAAGRAGGGVGKSPSPLAGEGGRSDEGSHFALRTARKRPNPIGLSTPLPTLLRRATFSRKGRRVLWLLENLAHPAKNLPSKSPPRG